MAIITLNNNSLSSVTSLPAAISTGKVLQVVTASTDDTEEINNYHKSSCYFYIV